MSDRAAYSIDGRPAAAEGFYAAACDPRTSVVVEACAGAGKTWMLVSRMLRALLAGAEPQQILAITFTKKAAGEMRARLDEWLYEFGPGAGEGPGAHALRVQELARRGLGPAEAEAAAPTLAALHERVLASGRAVEVRTFHAWFAQLLGHAPLALTRALDLPHVFELIEEPQPLFEPLLRRFHRRVNADPALREVYLRLVALQGRGTVRQWCEQGFVKRVELAAADAADTLEDGVAPAAARWPECAGLADPAALLLADAALRAELAAMADQWRRLPKSKAANDAAAGIDAALACDDPDQAFHHAWLAFHTQQHNPRKQVPQGPRFDAMCERLGSIRAMRLQQRAHDDHRAMVHLWRVLRAEYAALKRERGLVDMDDLETAALSLLADGDVAAWVHERLDRRVRHLLVDEFQDTSPRQWRALQGWLAGYAGAGGGASGREPLAVFIVGDPKQSIYRFRGAEPRVFDAARRFVVEAFGGRALECDHTRRCAPAVTAAFNAVFAQAAAAGEFGPFRAHTTSSQADGAVLALPAVPKPPKAASSGRTSWRDSLAEPRREVDELPRRIEAERVAAAIGQLLAAPGGLRPGDVMVLARKRAPLVELAAALAAAAIPHALAEPLVLMEVPEVQDLVALLDALVSPGHDLSLARALKSPVFGAGDDELLWLARAARERGRAWIDALTATDAAPWPSPALARAATLVARWRAVVHELPPHDLLDRIVNEGDVEPRTAAAVPPARRAFALQALRALLEAALVHRGARFASAYGFLRELNAGQVVGARAAPPAAVQLLTVHGAKGLEAKVVFVIDADHPAPAPSGPTVLVDWPAEAASPRVAAFVRGSSSAMAPALADAWGEHDRQCAREELNTLYVAMTRATERLVLSTSEGRSADAKASAAGPTWWARALPHAAPWTEPPMPALPAAGHETHVAVETLPPLRGDAPGRLATRPAAPPPVRRGAAARAARGAGADAVDPASARFGEALHRALEWVARPGAALPSERWGAACEAAARAFGLPAAAAGELHARLESVLHSPELARFFGGDGLRWAANEVPLSHAGVLLRVDRLVELATPSGGSAWWVLDYKLGSQPERLPEHREQLAAYAAALRAAQPGDAVHAAFVTSGGRLVEIEV